MMKYYTENTSSEKDLKEQFDKDLAKIREHRKFNVEQYIDLKSRILNQYMEKSNLNTAVIACSGGIDSAVVLALVNHAFSMCKTKRTINAVFLPAHEFDNHGVTNQSDAQDRFNELCNQNSNVKAINIDISKIAKTIHKKTSKHFKDITRENDWAVGQLIPYTRTPVLYYLTTWVAQNDHAFIIGTTNRDEGAYLGYVGKASDGMVDYQLISDLHKSEVYQVAEYFEKRNSIPSSIIKAVPSGDMYDHRTDEEVFGCSYNAVEYYLNSINSDSKSKYPDITKAIEGLHKYNAHKYLAGSPAIHHDIYESGVYGGWDIQFETKYRNTMFKQGNIVRECFVAPIYGSSITNKIHEVFGKSEKQKLSHKEVNFLQDLYISNNQKTVKANNQGYLINNDNTMVSDKQIGSRRLSLYSVELADIIWNRIRGNMELLQFANTPITDWNKGDIWRAVGVNPLFRYISYDNNDNLIAHYDYAYTDLEHNYRSLYTIVMYLTTNESGHTIFVEDDNFDSWNKDLSDYSVEDTQHSLNNIIKSVKPTAGKIEVFPHHLLHIGDTVKNNEWKLIMRTDVMFEFIGNVQTS